MVSQLRRVELTTEPSLPRSWAQERSMRLKPRVEQVQLVTLRPIRVIRLALRARRRLLIISKM